MRDGCWARSPEEARSLAQGWEPVPPRDAKVGDQYRLDIVLRQKKRIVGGNTYVFGIVAEPEA